MNFYDRPDCITLSAYTDAYGTKSGIFLFKNIINKDYINRIEKQLKDLEKPYIDYEKTIINWYAEKVTPPIEGLIEVWEEISKLIGPTWVMHPSNNLLMVKPGDNGMFVHSDSPGKGACHLLSQPDVWSTCCELDYGVVAYFGDFEGGEVYYPRINPDGSVKGKDVGGECFEYKVEKGDVIIHSAFEPYDHGVREVTSGTRYAFANFSLKAEDNPGSFYNYPSKEYFDQVGNKTLEELREWVKPLKSNPQFSDEKIKAMQKSGLQGEELSKKFFKDGEL